MADATKAIGVIKVDMLVDDLHEIIELGLKLAEDVTGLPMLLQGQQGKRARHAGRHADAEQQRERRAAAAGAALRRPHHRAARAPLLRLAARSTAPEDEKGDYNIDARGSSALVERDLQNQAIAQMGS
jgi:hypothetical protein